MSLEAIDIARMHVFVYVGAALPPLTKSDRRLCTCL